MDAQLMMLAGGEWSMEFSQGRTRGCESVSQVRCGLRPVEAAGPPTSRLTLTQTYLSCAARTSRHSSARHANLFCTNLSSLYPASPRQLLIRMGKAALSLYSN